MEITLRQATSNDRDGVALVESKATRNLKYLPHVYDLFLSDDGDFSVALVEGEVVGCAKFTCMPDGSAWLEALRVIPERQGLGIGKRFYQRFFEQARARGIHTMRMYTGMRNVVSKGLAEHFGFGLAATYRDAWLTSDRFGALLSGRALTAGFVQVRDHERASALLMSYKDKWTGFMVMNRTFYGLTPQVCAYFADTGCVFENTKTGSVLVAGARFMVDQALHIALLGGDKEACLAFAAQKARELGVGRLQCMFPPTAIDVEQDLTARGFCVDESNYIVMEVNIPA